MDHQVTPTLFPERTLADSLYRLWLVEQGHVEMSPQEAAHHWATAKAHVDQYKVNQAMVAARKAHYEKQIDYLNDFKKFVDRYFIRSMRVAGVEEIEGDFLTAKIKETTSYTVMDQPNVEDMAALPHAVESSLEWISDRPDAALLAQIIEAVVDHPDDVFALRRKLKTLIFAPTRFTWAKLGNGHAVIHNILKKDPEAIEKNRYLVTIKESLSVSEKNNGRRKAKTTVKPRPEHGVSTDAHGAPQIGDSKSPASAHDSRADDERGANVSQNERVPGSV